MNIWNEIEIIQAYNNFIYAFDQWCREQDVTSFNDLKACEKRYRKLSGKRIMWLGDKSLVVRNNYRDLYIN